MLLVAYIDMGWANLPMEQFHNNRFVCWLWFIDFMLLLLAMEAGRSSSHPSPSSTKAINMHGSLDIVQSGYIQPGGKC